MHALLLAVCCLVSGHVHAASGAPLAGARVVLRGPVTIVLSSDATGAIATHVSPGDYQVNAVANGYTPVSTDVKIDRDVALDFSLEPLDAPTLRTISVVTVDGRLAPNRGAIPSITVTRADMERLGDDRIVQALQTLPGATFARPDGGGANAVSVVALRGPDPSESLVTLDGQLLNDGNTGDLDLSRLPIAAFAAVDVTEGLGPEDSNGSNTFGGSINLVSLAPTQKPHWAFSQSAGSFGHTETWANATGSRGRLGYAFALDNTHQLGYANAVVPLYSSVDPTCSPCTTLLGSSVASHAALGNVSWSFSQRANVTARVFLLGDSRDQSGSINGINGLAGTLDAKGDAVPVGAFIGPGAQTFSQNIRAYQVRGQAPLGAGEVIANAYASNNDIGLAGNPSNPAYDVTHVDHRYNGEVSWQRTFDRSNYSIGGYTRYESLQFLAPPSSDGSTLTSFQQQPLLGQTIDTFYVRGGLQATKELRLDAGLFQTHYSTFGSNLDSRIGAIYYLDPKTSLRASFGTGFRPPLLFERYVFPLSQLAQDQYGVFVGQGSPNERPEHATEYELGLSHHFQSATLDVSLYRTNLRNPIEIYYPYQRALANGCVGQTPQAPIAGCTSYQSNIGNAVYQGAELRFVQRFAPQHLFLTAMYGLNVAYPKDLTADFSNPTSGANLVDNRQFGGIPQQQGSLELDWVKGDWHAAASAVFRGTNNELNTGPFTRVNASVGVKLDPMMDLTFAGTNIFNDGAGRYTIFGAGVPYLGIDNAPIPSDRYGVEPFGLRMILTIRH